MPNIERIGIIDHRSRAHRASGVVPVGLHRAQCDTLAEALQEYQKAEPLRKVPFVCLYSADHDLKANGGRSDKHWLHDIAWAPSPDVQGNRIFVMRFLASFRSSISRKRALESLMLWWKKIDTPSCPCQMCLSSKPLDPIDVLLGGFSGFAGMVRHTAQSYAKIAQVQAP